jgi:hypothetical protein
MRAVHAVTGRVAARSHRERDVPLARVWWSKCSWERNCLCLERALGASAGAMGRAVAAVCGSKAAARRLIQRGCLRKLSRLAVRRERLCQCGRHETTGPSETLQAAGGRSGDSALSPRPAAWRMRKVLWWLPRECPGREAVGSTARSGAGRRRPTTSGPPKCAGWTDRSRGEARCSPALPGATPGGRNGWSRPRRT